MVKKPPANVGEMGSIPGSGRSPGEGNGNLLQYSCLGNPMDRGAWLATGDGATRVRQDLATKQSVLNPKSLKPSSGQVTFYCSHSLPQLQSLMHLNEHHAATAAGPQWKLYPSCHYAHKDKLGQSCSLSSSSQLYCSW